jgi:hypothetical protein
MLSTPLTSSAPKIGPTTLARSANLYPPISTIAARIKKQLTTGTGSGQFSIPK